MDRVRKNMCILITTFWTDRNKGDASLNIAIIRFIRKIFPEASIIVCSVYGANQFDLIERELYLTKREDIDSIIGNVFPTYHRLDRRLSSRGITRKFLYALRAMLTVGFAILILVAACLKLAKIIAYILPREFKRSLETFLSADIIISRRSVIPSAINAGLNMLTIMVEPYILFKSLYDMFLAIALRKPLIIIGCSIWPLVNPISKILLRWVLNRCGLIVVREEFSYNYIRTQLKIRNKNLYILPDLAIFLYGENKWQQKPYPRSKVKQIIGFTFVDWYAYGLNKRENYIQVMANIIKFIKENYDAEIIVIPQVTYSPEDPYDIARLIVAKSGINVKIIHEELTLDELLKLYSSCDFVIATPVHSAILSLVVGTPVIAIAYDDGFKHIGIMKMFGMERYVLPFYFLNLQSLIKTFNEAWLNRVKLHNDALRSTRILLSSIDTFVPFLQKFIRKNLRYSG